MELFGNDLGSWAEWAAALASVISVAIAIIALKYARDANKTADDSMREASAATARAQQREAERDQRDSQREAERDQREKQRDRRRVAGNLQAWWAADTRSTDKGEWGIVLSNDGAATSVFRDVKITTTANGHESIIDVRVVPPGRFFINNQTPDRWGLPRWAPPSEHLDPIMKSAKHTVDRISFTDPLGDCWEWTAAGGLTARATTPRRPR